jgi:hypothetical protein
MRTTPQMPEEKPDAQFWQIVDAVINAANDQCEHAARTKVSAATLFAAARFNVFATAVAAQSSEAIAAERESVVAYLTQQYERMLRDNLAEYERNFDRYVPKPGT